MIKNPLKQKSLEHRASSVLRWIGSTFVWLAAYFFISTGNGPLTSAASITDENPLATPEVGAYGLRVLSPTVLELTLINTKDSISAPVPSWNFVSDTGVLNLPAAGNFAVTANSQTVSISSMGFKRRPIYAPVKARDLRIGNSIYLKLAAPLAEGVIVEVKNPSGNVWSAPTQFVATNDALRFNPAIHVNQVGYMPVGPKKAMVGYYLGSLGEMDVPTANGFNIVNASSGAVVFSGSFTQRKDVGYTYTPTPYQKVYEADFSAFTTPGEYRLQVPGMGASFSFMINEGTAATFARSFAMGLFHQRCGTDMDLPFTRFDHGFCHTNTVEVPTAASDFMFTWNTVASKSSDYANEPRHTAPQLKSLSTSLYPFVRQGRIDVSKGHHDAGDYSKYTINSAGLIHHLVFAADSFAGAGVLDNLGIPESGDGKSDLLQEAKWEADYLAKMQDTDGGFYFLVYPKNREYEDNVTPDHGDPQVVWPKTTSVTAAATAALAEIASSPRFKQQFPVEAAAYMAKAQLGWTFLMNAIAAHGKDGAYQKITHYGNEFMHDDELAWAASAMFAATANPVYLTQLKAWMPDPNSTSIRRWGWWRMFEGWGCAIRTYAFAARSGRIATNLMDSAYLAKCDAEIIATGDDIMRFSNQTAYGMSFGDPYKNNQDAGWNFASERAFDITVAYQINPKAAYKEAVFANVNYEGGCNPVNVVYVTGIGWKRQHDTVNQYAQNDRRVLPPSGLPLGNVVRTFQYLWDYNGELEAMCFPSDFASTAPYPYYDRWGDSYNTTAEFVVVDVARSLGSLAYWMAQSGIATQAWKSGTAQITALPAQVAVGTTAMIGLTAPDLDLTGAQIVWEVKYLEPGVGANYTFSPKYPGDTWVEAEALLPDGRRVYAKTNFTAMTGDGIPPNAYQSAPVPPGTNTAAIYHLDNNLTDATGKQVAMGLSGNAVLDGSNLAWLVNRAGTALRFLDLGDQAKVMLPAASIVSDTTAYLSVEAMIYINDFKAYNRGNATILKLEQGWNAYLTFGENIYNGPQISGGQQWSYGSPALKDALTLKTWHHLSLRIDTNGYVAKLDGNVLSSTSSSELGNWNSSGPVTLQVGDFDGWIDEIVVRSSTVKAAAPVNIPPTVSVSASSANLTAPATINLSAVAADSDGTVAKVEFFKDTAKIGEATSAPFTFTWTSVGAGTYNVTAKATDNLGAATASTPVSVTVTPGAGATNGTSTASLVGIDAATEGNWRGHYGADGFKIIGDGESIPAYASVSSSDADQYTWAASTSEPRALLKAAGTDRLASVWYAGNTFNIDFEFTDSNTHRVSVYVMDWDNTGRAETFDVIDPNSGAVLSSTNVSNFGQGKYLTWDLRGNAQLRASLTAGNNVIVEGIFFDAAPRTSVGAALKVKGAVAQGLQIEVSGDVGIYTVQSSSDMKTWTSIGPVTLSGATVTIVDSTTSGNSGMRFYRVSP